MSTPESTPVIDPGTFARRRRTVGWGILAAAGLYLGAHLGSGDLPILRHLDAGVQGIVQQARPDSGAAYAEELLTADLGRAQEHLTKYGTLKDFRPTQPVGGAIGANIVVLVVDVDGVCYSTGIVPGYDGSIQTDQTGQRCNADKLAELAKSIN